MHKNYNQPNIHAIGKAIAVVLMQTQIKINTGIPTKIERAPRNGCFQINRSAFLSNSYSNFRMDFLIFMALSPFLFVQ